MYRKTAAVSLIVVAGMVVAVSALHGVAFAQKDSVPKREDKLALGEDDAKELLLLIDTDENGKIMNRKITKQEWLMFMEAEFDRLDHDKSGKIDGKELEQSTRREKSFSCLGK
jgi:Ca2+-binding EF-hand superfamily protein